MTGEGFSLNSKNVRDYLAGRGLAPDGREAQVRELGGVSNVVLLIEWPGGAGW